MNNSLDSALHRILLVEDNDDIRDLTKLALEMEGYSVNTATNGQEALESLKIGELPKAIFLDMHMPVMGGREFLKAKNEAGLAPEAAVIVFAATKEVESLEGVAQWLKKPVDLEDLIAAAKRHAG